MARVVKALAYGLCILLLGGQLGLLAWFFLSASMAGRAQ